PQICLASPRPRLPQLTQSILKPQQPLRRCSKSSSTPCHNKPTCKRTPQRNQPKYHTQHNQPSLNQTVSLNLNQPTTMVTLPTNHLRCSPGYKRSNLVHAEKPESRF